MTLVTLGASLLTGIVFGMLPALQASRPTPRRPSRRAADSGATRSRGRSVLVVGEIALTLLLLVSAALLATSFLRLASVRSGFNPDHVDARWPDAPAGALSEGGRPARLFTRLLDALQARGEVEAVAVGFPGPLHGTAQRLVLHRRTSAAADDMPSANIADRVGRLFRGHGHPTRRRPRVHRRDTADAPPVAIVSAAMARKYWPGQNPIGRHLRFDEATRGRPWSASQATRASSGSIRIRRPSCTCRTIVFPLPFTSRCGPQRAPAVGGHVRCSIDARVGGSESRVHGRRDDAPGCSPGISASRGSARPRSARSPCSRCCSRSWACTASSASRLPSGLARSAFVWRSGRRRPRSSRRCCAKARLAVAANRHRRLWPAALAATRLLRAFLFDVGAADPVTYAAVSAVLLSVAVAASICRRGGRCASIRWTRSGRSNRESRITDPQSLNPESESRIPNPQSSIPNRDSCGRLRRVCATSVPLCPWPSLFVARSPRRPRRRPPRPRRTRRPRSTRSNTATSDPRPAAA